MKKRPFIRLFTAKNKKLFAEKLPTEAPLINDCDLTDHDCAYDIFSENYSTLYNKFFPYVRMSRKASKDKPHITAGIKVSIRYKDKLLKKYFENRTDENLAAYKSFKNKTNIIIKKLK